MSGSMLVRLGLCVGFLAAEASCDSSTQSFVATPSLQVEEDVGGADLLVPPPDAASTDAPQGLFDAGATTDGQTNLFADPSIISQGLETIDTVKLWVTVRGDLETTLPPIIVIPTGPSLGHEYLLPTTEFLLGPGGRDNPSRLLVYFDPRASGRSRSGSTIDAEVNLGRYEHDLSGIVDFASELVGDDSEVVDFLGHGFGAALAALYASKSPERVGRMLLSNPFPSNIQEHSLWIEETLVRLSPSERERYIQVTNSSGCARDWATCSREIWNLIGPTWVCEENEQDTFRELDVQFVDWRPFAWYLGEDLRESSYDWQPDLAAIPAGVPTTIIAGPCDPIPTSAAEVYRSSVPGSVLRTLEGSGHFPMVEQSEAFREAVLSLFGS